MSQSRPDEIDDACHNQVLAAANPTPAPLRADPTVWAELLAKHNAWGTTIGHGLDSRCLLVQARRYAQGLR